MKTPDQIDNARTVLCARLTENIRREQRLILTGMLNALVWAADGRHGSTLDDILNGKPIKQLPGPQLLPTVLQLPAEYTVLQVDEAFNQIKNGYTHACCPDHWADCDAARTLAAVYIYWATGKDITV